MRRPIICEVGPRDGLQNLARPFSVAERAALISHLARAGARHIEAVSFVNPKRVPQMADAEAVLEAIEVADDVRLAGLVLNVRGAERAAATRLHEVRFVVVASETFSRRNQNATVAETIDAFGQSVAPVKATGKTITGVVAASFGCPFEGEVAPERVVEIVGALVEAGADEIILADTIGVGVPAEVGRLAALAKPIIGGRPLGFHFHNTRNTGYANAIAALITGADFLDASIGGLGGCPFAPAATGNIATEDLHYLLTRSGYATGLDGEALFAVVAELKTLVPEAVVGLLTRAGSFPR